MGLLLFCGLFIGCTDAKSTDPTPAPTNTIAPTNTTAPKATNTPTPIPSPTELPTLTPIPSPTELPGIKDVYAENFTVGVALPNSIFLRWVLYNDTVLANFNSFTCENEMKPDSILDQTACRANLQETYLHPALKFSSSQKAVDAAVESGVKMRLHTLVWHSQTPKWFFTEDYTANGALVSREVMLQRMESYIEQVLTYYSTNYPGLIYAIDVVNEVFDVGNGDADGIRQKDNMWYTVVGADYYYQAFVFAKKYASDDMKLFYNDYSCMYKPDLILKHLQPLQDEGLIDGIGMQGHLDLNTKMEVFVATAKRFCEAGYEVQITELDIGMDANNERNMMLQGIKYKVLMQGLKNLAEQGYEITGVTFWGLTDGMSWRTGKFPLLFDDYLTPKDAYYGVLLDPEILDFEP